MLRKDQQTTPFFNQSNNSQSDAVAEKKKFRNEYAKKGFYTIWKPTKEVLMQPLTSSNRMSDSEYYENGYRGKREPEGDECQKCCEGCINCLGKILVGTVGGTLSLLGGCGGFFVGAAKDCCTPDEKNQQADEGPKQQMIR